MKWLTLTEIGRRARSKKGALEVSYEHWCQLFSATASELRRGYIEGKVDIGNEHCGLCRYYNDICGKCLLCISDGCCKKASGTLFTDARDEFLGSNWWAWKRAAKALRDKLKELMQE